MKRVRRVRNWVRDYKDLLKRRGRKKGMRTVEREWEFKRRDEWIGIRRVARGMGLE